MGRASIRGALVALACALGATALAAPPALAQPLGTAAANVAIQNSNRIGHQIAHEWSDPQVSDKDFCQHVRDAERLLDALGDMYDLAILSGQLGLAAQIAREADRLDDLLEDVWEDIDCWPPYTFFEAFTYPGYVNAPTIGPSIVFSGGGGANCVWQLFTDTVSDGSSDPHSMNPRTQCGGQFFGGVSLELPLGSVPTGPPINLRPIIFGLETTLWGGAGNTTFLGTPALLPPQTDTYRMNENFIGLINATATVPITPSLSVIGRGGFAVGYGTFQYGCSGYCALAGVAPFSQTDSMWQFGGDIGAGIQYTPPGSALSWHFDFTQVFLADKTANPETKSDACFGCHQSQASQDYLFTLDNLKQLASS